jgi:hypothetical protein
MGFVDTGLNIPESLKTLLAQQAQLLSGKRVVQMFPIGTSELPLPDGMSRHQNDRGIFHFRAEAVSAAKIDELAGRENEILNLGPFNKTDIAERMAAGERILAVAEFDPEGVEVRAAAGTLSTLPDQIRYFDATKEDGNKVEALEMVQLIIRRLS